MIDMYSPYYIADPYNSSGVTFKLKSTKNKPKQIPKKQAAKVAAPVTPPPRVSEQFYQIVEKSRAVDKLIKDAGDKPKYEDLKKETEPDIQKELDFWDRHNGKLLTE